MKTIQPEPTGKNAARFCIWTVLHQDEITSHFRIYVMIGSGILLFLFVIGRIDMQVALGGLSIGGAALLVLIWQLIQARKKSLNAIRDPELRAEAHAAMCHYLSRKHLSKKDRKKLFGHPDRNVCLWNCPE